MQWGVKFAGVEHFIVLIIMTCQSFTQSLQSSGAICHVLQAWCTWNMVGDSRCVCLDFFFLRRLLLRSFTTLARWSIACL